LIVIQKVVGAITIPWVKIELYKTYNFQSHALQLPPSPQREKADRKPHGRPRPVNRGREKRQNHEDGHLPEKYRQNIPGERSTKNDVNRNNRSDYNDILNCVPMALVETYLHVASLPDQAATIPRNRLICHQRDIPYGP
jgi:hypothetical protein